MKLFYAFLLGWTRIDLRIARSAPVQNIAHLERLRRDEYEYEHALLMLRVNA